MNPVVVRNVAVGEGIPKVCVPVVGVTREEVIKSAGHIRSVGADIIEWRADWYGDIFALEKAVETAKALRGEAEDIPVLFTFRTAKEGGQQAIGKDAYAELNKRMIKSGYIDLVDVEAFTGEDTVAAVIEAAHERGVKVVASNHDFQGTPAKEEIVARLRKMQEMGADILKIAVMPQTKKDVLTLLAATEEMCGKYATRPVITMSMAEMGAVSRLCGEVFGSAVTFGAAGKASAPGQMAAQDLKAVLGILHKSLRNPE